MWNLSCVLLLALASAQEAPAVFQDVDFDGALQATVESDKLFLLDCMTEWCGPCKTMDKTTWVDPELVAWMDSKIIAVQLDMDQHEALGKRLGVNAFPTLVLFKNGREFDRVIGARNADDLQGWLQGALVDQTHGESVLAELTGLRAKGSTDLSRRESLAGELLGLGDLDQARAELLWLWDQRSTGEERIRRRGSLANKLQTLARQDRLSRSLIEQERATLEERLEVLSQHVEDRADWLVLNRILDEQLRSGAWAGQAAGLPEGAALLRAQESRLFSVLVDQGRFVSAGLCLQNPRATARALVRDIDAYDRAAAGEDGQSVEKRTSMPAIPMGVPAASSKPAGGMTPAQPIGSAQNDEAKSEAKEEPNKAPAVEAQAEPAPEEAAAEPTSMPAIPMMAPAKAVAKHAAPGETGGETGEETSAQAVRVEVKRRLRWKAQEECGRMYASLLAAGRTRDASVVAELLLAGVESASARASLVAWSLRSNTFAMARERHLQWLVEASER